MTTTGGRRGGARRPSLVERRMHTQWRRVMVNYAQLSIYTKRGKVSRRLFFLCFTVTMIYWSVVILHTHRSWPSYAWVKKAALLPSSISAASSRSVKSTTLLAAETNTSQQQEDGAAPFRTHSAHEPETQDILIGIQEKPEKADATDDASSKMKPRTEIPQAHQEDDVDSVRRHYRMSFFYPVVATWCVLCVLYFGQRFMEYRTPRRVWAVLFLFDSVGLCVSLALLYLSGSCILGYFGFFSSHGSRGVGTINGSDVGDDGTTLTSLSFERWILNFSTMPTDSSTTAAPLGFVKLHSMARIVRLQYQFAMFEIGEVASILAAKKFRSTVGLMSVYVKTMLMWAWFLGARHLLICTEIAHDGLLEQLNNNTTITGVVDDALVGTTMSSTISSPSSTSTSSSTNNYNFAFSTPDASSPGSSWTSNEVPTRFAGSSRHTIWIVFVMNVFSVICYSYYLASMLLARRPSSSSSSANGKITSAGGSSGSMLKLSTLVESTTSISALASSPPAAPCSTATPTARMESKTLLEDDFSHLPPNHVGQPRKTSSANSIRSISFAGEAEEVTICRSPPTSVHRKRKRGSGKSNRYGSGGKKRSRNIRRRVSDASCVDAEEDDEDSPVRGRSSLRQLLGPLWRRVLPEDENDPNTIARTSNTSTKISTTSVSEQHESTSDEPVELVDRLRNFLKEWNDEVLRHFPQLQFAQQLILFCHAVFQLACLFVNSLLRRLGPYVVTDIDPREIRVEDVLFGGTRELQESTSSLSYSYGFQYTGNGASSSFFCSGFSFYHDYVRPLLNINNPVIPVFELLVCSQLLLIYIDFNAEHNGSSWEEQEATELATSKRKNSKTTTQDSPDSEAGSASDRNLCGKNTDAARQEDDAKDEEATLPSPARFCFSFDSSGWLYMYHWGVATFIYDHFDNDYPNEMGFSGASGGALVAGALALGLNPKEVCFDTIRQSSKCQYNIAASFRLCEATLEKWVPRKLEDIVRANGRLRVLMTQLQRHPPFARGQVASFFSDRKHLVQCLRASAHIPLLAGVLPYWIEKYKSYYVDGLCWLSLFVHWRGFTNNDHVVRVSATGAPNADIGPSRMFPFWWALFPPSEEVLEGMFWQGYVDAMSFFSQDQKLVRRSGFLCGCGRMKRRKKGAGHREQMARDLGDENEDSNYLEEGLYFEDELFSELDETDTSNGAGGTQNGPKLAFDFNPAEQHLLEPLSPRSKLLESDNYSSPAPPPEPEESFRAQDRLEQEYRRRKDETAGTRVDDGETSQSPNTTKRRSRNGKTRRRLKLSAQKQQNNLQRQEVNNIRDTVTSSDHAARGETETDQRELEQRQSSRTGRLPSLSIPKPGGVEDSPSLSRQSSSVNSRASVSSTTSKITEVPQIGTTGADGYNRSSDMKLLLSAAQDQQQHGGHTSDAMRTIAGNNTSYRQRNVLTRCASGSSCSSKTSTTSSVAQPAGFRIASTPSSSKLIRRRTDYTNDSRNILSDTSRGYNTSGRGGHQHSSSYTGKNVGTSNFSSSSMFNNLPAWRVFHQLPRRSLSRQLPATMRQLSLNEDIEDLIHIADQQIEASWVTCAMLFIAAYVLYAAVVSAI
ncbi:unnamed protein product [Amoebophrya sp. A25]|nr:unnamed protein product [Amoebophrya sp. A25]|eukprot:GSA25T00000535001.1